MIITKQGVTAEKVAIDTNGGGPKSNSEIVNASGKDVRYVALRNFALSITILNIFGYWLLGFEQPILWPFLALACAYVIDLAFESLYSWSRSEVPRYQGRGWRGVYEFLLPAHITALAINMLLYANNQFWPIAFGIIAGITSKYVLRAPLAGKMRHFMNPSNFGITVVLIFFSSWVAVAPPYQFTENVNSMLDIAIPLILATAGTVLNASLTGKIPLIVGWLGGFVIQAVVRHELFDVALIAALGTMTGTAFILFTNYMITDPGTTPFPARAQFIFGASCATVYGILMALDVVYTLFFAVTIVCIVRGLYGWTSFGWMRARARARRSSTAATVELLAPAS